MSTTGHFFGRSKAPTRPPPHKSGQRLIHRLHPVFRPGLHGGVDLLGLLNLPGDPKRVRAPDVAFVSSSRLPEGRLPQGLLSGAPGLAVEVLSPTDNPLEVQQKVRDYLDAGSRLVWVVAPQAKTVTVYRGDGSARLLREREHLEGEDVLPGLMVPLAEIFQ